MQTYVEKLNFLRSVKIPWKKFQKLINISKGTFIPESSHWIFWIWGLTGIPWYFWWHNYHICRSNSHLRKSRWHQNSWTTAIRKPGGLSPIKNSSKVENILKGSLDLIPSPSEKIQIMGGIACLRCKGKTWLGVANKLLKAAMFCFYTSSKLSFP